MFAAISVANNYDSSFGGNLMLLVGEPILGEEEKAALLDVIDCGWITMGDRVRTFERSFAETHNASDAVAVSSCTAALHLILEVLGVGPGDEVLVPSLTFVATVNSVLYARATPIFVDIESLDCPLISRSDAAAKCTKKTKAVILMHYAGYVLNRGAWRDFAATHGLILIEDAAHAVGAEYAGTFGSAAAFSFYGNKNMTTAEGGAVIAADDRVLEEVRTLRGHGLTTGTFQRLSSRSVTYDVTMLGYNYRMDELRAAIGLAQLSHLRSWNEKRKTLTQLYMRLLADRCPQVKVPFLRLDGSTAYGASYHIMPVVLPDGLDRQSVIDELRDAGIQTTNHYPPAHLLSFYRKHSPSVTLPRTEHFARRELTLPLHPRMEESHVDRVSVALADSVTR
jgi:dTDP-4-amino-4,6-dideoxygalactose transaminase